ncbi:endolytic transglycosylase MltG [Glycomyces niveus]|uniref:Endolytic murein transglycosylase n=1 Tax=Glycomyces niveus TaxID=2820287 RepID=A0ABS3U7Y2_9ACTN|nr:endolytic transglycosylase MltG [Glycomyces sp. NEAU-S30]MBO3734887.1 endolytic transglycosylase MltG [Glycomyces sp. NEAU-S30]
MLGDFRTEDERTDAPRSHRRKDSGKSLIAMTLVVALFAIIGVGGWWAYNNVIKDYFIADDFSGDGNGTEVTVTVEEGWFVSDIANHLEEVGVVASAKAFVNASEDNDNAGTSIQPGTYLMEEEMSAASALDHLTKPENRIVNGFTVVEGKTSFEIYAELSEKYGIPVEEFEEVAKDPVALGVPEYWFENFKTDQIVSIEGFLFPSTYEFDEGATATDMLKAMVAKFNAVVDEIDFKESAEALDLEPWMALQVASIIQSESGTPEDDAKIAQVMYNRLYADGAVDELGCNCLGSEAIWNYGREFDGLEPIPSADMTGDEMWDENNRWAASVQEGYFPTPIASPSQAALEGAVNPEDGTWLYFVTAYKDGRAIFSNTYTEHQDATEIARENGMA